MRVWHGREIKLNFDNYEGENFNHGVSLDHHDYGYTDEQWAALSDDERVEIQERIVGDVLAYVDERVEADLRAAEPYLHRNSFAHDALDDLDDQSSSRAERAPRRTVKRRSK